MAKHCWHMQEQKDVYSTVDLGLVGTKEFKCCWCGKWAKSHLKWGQVPMEGHGPAIKEERLVEIKDSEFDRECPAVHN